MNRTEYNLDNGIKVILQPTTTAPVVACNVWVGVGSADEEPAEAGLAHVHEHMLFKGTTRRGVGEIARDVEAAGGHINAFTSFDQTCYYVVMSSRYLDNGLDILADAIQNSAFDAEELSRELEVIQEEIKRGNDHPPRVASQMLFETAFKTHPYRLPIIGSKESVDSFTREDVHAFFKKHYVPENLTVVLAGDFEVKEAQKLVEKYFADFEGPAYKAVQRPAEPVQAKTRAALAQQDIRQNHLRVGFHIPHARHEDIAAIDLLSIVLGYGDASHLDRTLVRESELVNAVFASAYTPREAGIFLLGADFQLDKERPETAPQEVLRRLMEETFRFRHVLPSSVELDRARTLLESQAIYSKQTIEGLAMKLGHYQMVAGDPGFEEEYYQALREVRPEDIRRVTRKYLSVENASVILLHPSEEATLTEERLIEAVEAAHERIEREAIDTAISTDESGFVRLELTDGPTLIVQEDPSVETFSIRALTLGGLRHETAQTAGLHKLLSSLITEGTATRSALEIASKTESMASSFGGISGRNSFGLAMTGLTRFFDPLFELFAESTLGATIPEEEFLRERKFQREQILAREDSLGAVNAEQFASAFFDPHPYGLPLIGTEESLQNLTAARLRKELQSLQQAEKWVISVVGDVKVADVINQVEKYFVSSTPRKAFDDSQVPKFQAPKEARIITADLEKEQAHVIVGFPGPLLHDEKSYALDVLYAVLSGQGGRLFYELRDRESLAYSVFASMMPGLDASAFTIRIGTSPEKVHQAISGILRELDKLRDALVPIEELDRAKRFLIGNHDIGLQRNSSRAMTFGLDELYSLGFRRSFHYGEAIEAVKASELRDLVNTYLTKDQMVVSVVKPSAHSVEFDL